VDFAKAFLKAGTPVAAICHGPQLLIETNLLEGRSMTSFPSIRTDLINAGANWLGEPPHLLKTNGRFTRFVFKGIHTTHNAGCSSR
jgi:protease I